MFSASRAYSTSGIIKPPPWSTTGIALMVKVYFYGTYTPGGSSIASFVFQPLSIPRGESTSDVKLVPL